MLKWSVQNNLKMSSAPQPRLCHVKKWSHFDGYGFTLHSEKNKGIQMIGKIDRGSPSEAGGLKPADRIIEINGANVTRENHNQVVQRIKAGGDETRLLVADKECKEYHDEHDIVITSSLPYVLHLSSENKEDSSSDSEEEESDREENVVREASESDEGVGEISNSQEEEESDQNKSEKQNVASKYSSSSSSSSSSDEDTPIPRRNPTTQNMSERVSYNKVRGI